MSRLKNKKGPISPVTKPRLQREFPVEYLKHYLESPAAAQDYYQTLRSEISSGTVDIKLLTVRRTIRKGEKQLAHMGNVGDKVEFYVTANGRRDNQGAYDINHYLTVLAEMKREIDDTIHITPIYYNKSN